MRDWQVKVWRQQQEEFNQVLEPVLREIINRKKLQQIASSRNDQGKICSRNQ
jgi:hypothetical protein